MGYRWKSLSRALGESSLKSGVGREGQSQLVLVLPLSSAWPTEMCAGDGEATLVSWGNNKGKAKRISEI